MPAGVAPQVDCRQGLGDHDLRGVLESSRLADQGIDRAVMGSVRRDVEEVHAGEVGELGCQGRDDFGPSSLADVRHELNHESTRRMRAMTRVRAADECVRNDIIQPIFRPS